MTVLARTTTFAVTGVPAKVRQVKSALGGKLSFIRAALQAAREPCDLVICGHINLLALTVLLNQYIRAPLALMVYGIDVWRQPNPLARRWLNAVDAVWSISAITQDRMNAWAALPEDRYTLLPNAIHLDRYGLKPRRQDLVARYGLDGAKVLLTLARLPSLERYKGVDEVLEVIPALLQDVPNLKYLVAGEGDDRARLTAKVHTLGLADRVVFAGMVDEADKADIFRLADAFVMPGRGEGFGFVFLEALACGVPAVGSRLDGSREALRGGELGELANPSDPASVRETILKALAKPAGVPPGLSYFAWPQFQDRLRDAMYKLVGHGGEPSP